jgi:hypothetical protein
MAALAPIIRWIRGDIRSGTGLLQSRQEPRIFMVQTSDVSMQGIQASRQAGRHSDIYIRRRNVPPSPEGPKGGSRHDLRDALAPSHEGADDSITQTVSLREVSNNPICHFLCCGWWPASSIL